MASGRKRTALTTGMVRSCKRRGNAAAKRDAARSALCESPRMPRCARRLGRIGRGPKQTSAPVRASRARRDIERLRLLPESSCGHRLRGMLWSSGTPASVLPLRVRPARGSLFCMPVPEVARRRTGYDMCSRSTRCARCRCVLQSCRWRIEQACPQHRVDCTVPHGVSWQASCGGVCVRP
jgi:hypothetical protein